VQAAVLLHGLSSRAFPLCPNMVELGTVYA